MLIRQQRQQQVGVWLVNWSVGGKGPVSIGKSPLVDLKVHRERKSSSPRGTSRSLEQQRRVWPTFRGLTAPWSRKIHFHYNKAMTRHSLIGRTTGKQKLKCNGWCFSSYNPWIVVHWPETRCFFFCRRPSPRLSTCLVRPRRSLFLLSLAYGGALISFWQMTVNRSSSATAD